MMSDIHQIKTNRLISEYFSKVRTINIGRHILHQNAFYFSFNSMEILTLIDINTYRINCKELRYSLKKYNIHNEYTDEQLEHLIRRFIKFDNNIVFMLFNKSVPY